MWETSFFTGGSVIMNYGFIFELETLMLDLCQVLSSPDVNWWTGVVGLLWCFIRLSFWRHPFTSIAETHCNATFLQIWWWETNSCTSRMTRRWAHFQQMFIFKWTVPLRSKSRIIRATKTNQNWILHVRIKTQTVRNIE